MGIDDATDLGSCAFGVWLVGSGLNYAPLAIYAVMLLSRMNWRGRILVRNCAAMVSCSYGSSCPRRSLLSRFRQSSATAGTPDGASGFLQTIDHLTFKTSK